MAGGLPEEACSAFGPRHTARLGSTGVGEGSARQRGPSTALGAGILDERTSAVDDGAEREVFAGMRGTKAERITIVVPHRVRR